MSNAKTTFALGFFAGVAATGAGMVAISIYQVGKTMRLIKQLAADHVVAEQPAPATEEPAAA